MAETRKSINRTGERKKTSARRSYTPDKAKYRDRRWLHVIAAIIVSGLFLYLTVYIIQKSNFFRFAVCEGEKAYLVCLPKGDRLVKNYMKNGKFDGQAEKDLFGNVNVPFKMESKVIVPDDRELEENSRSRSAKLRIAERK